MVNHEIKTICTNCGHEYDAHLHWLVCPNCGERNRLKQLPVMDGIWLNYEWSEKEFIFLRCLLNISEKLDTIIDRLPPENDLPW